MAIFAFFVTCVSGLVTDLGMEKVLLRGLAAMVVFFFIGLLVGAIANKILLDSLFGEEVPIEEKETEEEEPDAGKAEAARVK